MPKGIGTSDRLLHQLKHAMTSFVFYALLNVMTLLPHLSTCQSANGDINKTEAKEMLGKATEYFQSGKYHEALLLYRKIDKSYELSERTRAFMGVCAYYDGDYTLACTLLDKTLNRMHAYAPAEQSVYCFCDGQSHYAQKEYNQAITAFEMHFNRCHPNERTDTLVMLARCHLGLGNKTIAKEYLMSAIKYEKMFESKESPEKMQNILSLLELCQQI